MGFLYSILLKLLYPTSVALLLLLASAFLRRRALLPDRGRSLVRSTSPQSPVTSPAFPPPSALTSDLRPLTSARLARLCFWSALAVLMICGNGWVVKYSTRYLERQYPPLAQETTDHRPQTTDQGLGTTGPVSRERGAGSAGQRDHGLLTTDHRPQTMDQGLGTMGQQDYGPQTTDPRPPSSESPSLSSVESTSPQSPVSGHFHADAILILGGGILPATPPRPTIEIGEAGDRLLYGAYLFRQGRAPQIICTGNVATGGIASRPAAEDMADFLGLLGIPTNAIITEIQSENTHQHAVQLAPVFQRRGFKRILLVTSAMHMPRSMGVFRRQCPDVEFIPAPTDFQTVDLLPMPWYRHLAALIPTPRSLLSFCEVSHEYIGLAYYKLRGWI